ncbi:serine/threonine protein kinase, putative [Entamoeba invadens IP1]|uniref:Serine/threonine protein kinase, putative n=1 Tax=Entamoeba invadens IP1 TaxID=370355 RepID=A0A0A1UDS1_ENTIV|nr:serine/threonine protein kinase, putative [Entamoeba invadens IP1]ELP94750.1 serine/threonine protein kinase, putative [Entamoeba invadens IP1]|eukprot:XP_004261521.1 serine/threonine protein kinase, putative [Entamoeba invadens IP1]
MKPQPRVLDYESLRKIEQLETTPPSQRKVLNQLYFDVAVGQNKRIEYRLLWFRFDIRKLYLLRHGEPLEELLYSSFSYVTLEEGRIKLVTTDLVENSKVYTIHTQSPHDTVQIFTILRAISTVPTTQFYEEDYFQDYVNKKTSVLCKKRGMNAWSRREMIIFNGLFVLYNETSNIPITMCPMYEKVVLICHPRAILEITTLIRRILLHFESDAAMTETYNVLMTCLQYERHPAVYSVKDFFSGKLADLQQGCRDVCVKNQLYPEECSDKFAVLCEILRAVLKKKVVTQGTQKAVKKEEEELTRRAAPPPQQSMPEDDLTQYCERRDPKLLFKSFTSIGKGGFGEVFRAYSIKTNTPIALKVLKHSVDERYAKIGSEVARMKLWNHQNLIKTSGCWMFEHKVYIGMEYCSTGTLKSMIKPRGNCLGFPDIAYILLSTLSGLDYIHKSGFIHRDIKTANILMDDRFCIKIIDFGLVVRKSSMPQNRAGSKSYMAPEVIKQQPYDEKVDVWSVGCVAQELMESQPPYKEHGVIKGMFKTAAFGAQYLRDETKAPVDFVDFVDLCFEYDAKNRPSCESLSRVCSYRFFIIILL